MTVSTALSRVTGFVRVWVTAYALGVTALAASYHVANNIPNMVFELVAGGIISSLFIPVFMERWKQDSEQDAWRYASSLFNVTLIALGIIAVLATVFASEVVRTQTFRINPQDAELAVFFFQVFAVQIVFYGAGAIISGLLNAHRDFLWPALGPVFNNLTVIVTLLLYVYFSAEDPLLAKWVLALGTTLGVLVMFSVQLPSLIKLKPQYTFRVDLRHPGLQAMGRMAIPTIIYVVTNIVAVSFRNAYAFDVSLEGPAILSYAWMFYQLPYGVLAVSVATAFFTELSDAAGRKDDEVFRKRFAKGVSATAVLVIPSAAMLIALATPLITLYRAGRFLAEDIERVAAVLQWWAAGLFFFAAFMFVLRAFYSLKDTRTPMLVNLALTVPHIGLYAILTTGALGFSGIGLVGIPISDAMFYAAAFVVLIFLLRRKIGGFGGNTLVRTVAGMTVASVVGGTLAAGIAHLMPNPDYSMKIALATVVVAGTFGLLATWGVARLLNIQEVSVAVNLVRKAVAVVTGRKGSRR